MRFMKVMLVPVKKVAFGSNNKRISSQLDFLIVKLKVIKIRFLDHTPMA